MAYLRSVTENDTDRTNYLQMATLSNVRSIRSVFCEASLPDGSMKGVVGCPLILCQSHGHELLATLGEERYQRGRKFSRAGYSLPTLPTMASSSMLSAMVTRSTRRRWQW